MPEGGAFMAETLVADKTEQQEDLVELEGYDREHQLQTSQQLMPGLLKIVGVGFDIRQSTAFTGMNKLRTQRVAPGIGQIATLRYTTPELID